MDTPSTDHDRLDFATLTPDSDDPRVAGWLQAVARGFHEGRAGEESEQLWRRYGCRDRPALKGAWIREGEYGASAIPVATFGSFGGTLNTGATEVPLHFVTDVTVAPSHRRRGLLRRMMADDLQSAVEAGRPLAALTVSEGGIYGRFGYGLATWRTEVEVDVTARFKLAGHVDEGRMVVQEPEEMWPVPRDLFAQWHRATRGSLSRPAFYEMLARAEWDWEAQSKDTRLRGAVHLSADGEPDGYVLYRHEGWDRPPTVTVRDLVALTPSAYLSLWQFLAGIDLTERVKYSGPLDDPLPWALTDTHAYRVVKQLDHIWLRVLDVPAALSARPWYADGTVVLDVADAFGHAAGTWRVTSSGGEAKVERVSEPGTVSLDARSLGSLYLGGVSVLTLAAAGQVTGPGVEELAAMADGGPVPYSLTSF
ncbi:GNAT family N-acetyltransferase [Nocardioides gansuensis]|uniref:GNAT family N-acetyltransferase n=1 Tax=Nocardioides gansuensis TaxID=2138300 RepID=A0A2T8F9Z5_9ACTN|nr:GNAT family N-acetyltransferase [Nocardioides gansuensis]PVG82510.1 GNAT family N-acetyltransferase [Nocardioides gansuensis]